MKVRGERECQACGTRWSYYETGSIECPSCGSPRSVGVDDRTAHTDAPADLDLSPHRARFGDARGTLPEDGVDDLKTDLRAYARKRGFIRGGELLPLDSTYRAARELLEAIDLYDRLRDPTDAETHYLLDLLAGADDGERPDVTAVPETLRRARGMAAVRAADEYRTDVLAFLDELRASEEVTAGDSGVDSGRAGDDGSREIDEAAATVAVEGVDAVTRIAPARDALERLRDRTKRVDALNGDVDPADADALTDAADAIGEFVRSGDEAALARARKLLSEPGE
ncbi:hypothetical protein C461_06884 [Halorubrum aidingense JCM 13560]|uniref:TFIIB-type zinc ribbon-containing protein n=1 Tax=Halorubrum aidingense JCM 13560 TaxID=1230454 RepID=M0PBL9_9EURY|nr:hypothetical protein [Halorubrum aidingense]EMA67431.1 hypothetical protein C461_06884 [Halorubrum aidingense JCM 13560]